jgi:3-deoxy-D-manno-octulosonate 8-phosphate phosphatase (KDO 8-P phosphatase)
MVVNYMESAKERAKKIRMLLLDVDGVLAESRFILDGSGGEFKAFCSLDGVGLKLFASMGYTVGLISGRKSPATERRAAELGISEVFLGVDDKLAVFEELLGKYSLSADEVAYMGDDLPDLPLMTRAGLPAAVPDAVGPVKDAAVFISTRPGGLGAVRELVEFILKAQDRWDEAVSRFKA